MGKVQGIVWDLTHAEATIECVWDPTLHLGSLGKGRNGNAGTDTMPASSVSCSDGAQIQLQTIRAFPAAATVNLTSSSLP